jgi:hypothetical protein
MRINLIAILCGYLTSVSNPVKSFSMIGKEDEHLRIACTEFNQEVFGEVLTYLSKPDNDLLDPLITRRFMNHHEQGRLSVISTDTQTDDTSYIYTLDANPGHVAVVLNAGYYLGFRNRRSRDLIESYMDSAVLVKRSVEAVDRLVYKGHSFMSNAEFERKVADGIFGK